VTEPGASRTRKDHTFFAITSLGKNRWYWVVWPSLEMLQSGKSIQHVADGYERTKAQAVDQALEVAGMHGEWVAAKYARQYHRQRRKRAKGQEQGTGSTVAPVALEFLYQYVRDASTGQYLSVPHRVVGMTEKTVTVEQRAHDPERLTGSWLDHGSPIFRLSRTMLEQEGYALAPVTADVDDPLFFAAPYQEGVAQHAHRSLACFELLKLSFPCTASEVKAAYRRSVKSIHPDQGGSHDEFLALRKAYEQALRLCEPG
jgi:uncharacterized protein (DUF433 family)